MNVNPKWLFIVLVTLLVVAIGFGWWGWFQ
jgi:hypothetical protein